MSKKIHVAIGSTCSIPGHVDANLQQIADFASQARKDGVDILLTPEMSASGYGGYQQVLDTAEVPGDGPIYQRLAKLAHDSGAVICAGFVERAGEKRHLAHYAVWPDKKFIVQRKHRVTRAERPLDLVAPMIPPFNPFDDTGQFADYSKLQFNFFTVRGVKCGIAICADNGIARLPELFHDNGVELLLTPTGGGGKRKDRVVTDELRTDEGRRKYYSILQTVFAPGPDLANCIKFRRAQAAVNMCGYDGIRHHHIGHGMIINPMGEVVGFFHGIPNLDRQRPMYAHGVVDLDDCLPE